MFDPDPSEGDDDDFNSVQDLNTNNWSIDFTHDIEKK